MSDSQYGRLLKAFLYGNGNRENALFLVVARDTKMAHSEMRVAFEAINGEPTLRGRFLLLVSTSTIIDGRTRAKLRFVTPDPLSLAGPRPTEVYCLPTVDDYGRRLVQNMWGEPQASHREAR